MTMNDATTVRTAPRLVNVNSAIDRSSFQLPVLVAISTSGESEHIVQIFATARAVFVEIFSFKIDRLRERLSVDKVEKLVPTSAQLRASLDDEFVLIVRAKAVFWFSGKAVRRTVARQLLLEHALELARTEQAPFYMLRTRASVVRTAVVVLGFAACAGMALLAGQLSTHWADSLRDATARMSPFDTASVANAGHVERGGMPAASPQDANKPVADFTVPAGGWANRGSTGKDGD
jgi:hypothetical protein